MSAATHAPWSALLILATACTATESSSPRTPDAPEQAAVRVELATAPGIAVVGLAAAPLPDSDRLPELALFVRRSGGALRSLEIDALDATLDVDTGTLVWIDLAGTLWAAPLDRAPDGAFAIAERTLPGLASSRGRLAFAVRIDGPETAPFVADLTDRERQLTALDDGPGPDEVLAFSPDGDEVLLLSGRTGLSSLFAAGVDRPNIRQLTNVGLAPGPGLDPTEVAPAPIDRRDVAWGRRGIAYRADRAVILLEPGAPLARLGADHAVEEVAR